MLFFISPHRIHLLGTILKIHDRKGASSHVVFEQSIKFAHGQCHYGRYVTFGPTNPWGPYPRGSEYKLVCPD